MTRFVHAFVTDRAISLFPGDGRFNQLKPAFVTAERERKTGLIPFLPWLPCLPWLAHGLPSQHSGGEAE
jgi:hypothetical protein